MTSPAKKGLNPLEGLSKFSKNAGKISSYHLVILGGAIFLFARDDGPYGPFSHEMRSYSEP